MGSSPIFRIGQKRVRPNGLALFLTEAGADLNPGSRSPLRSGPRKAEVIYINENCTKWSSRKAWRFDGFANRVFRSVLLELNVYKVPEVLGRILWFNS